ncbi:MAG: tripartite tricarboxylate transporter substrate binding protein [Spirochaetales bacterium]|jgi:tripartite-type tricarboxylate transporter receptor subunit TctC|nr:tripartite tricarboxylate transporter substrate binding protein [Spirochaetales bacterium]
MKKYMTLFAAALILAQAVHGSGSSDGSAAGGKIAYPTKPIQIVCPVAPGGDTDRNTRVLAQLLGKHLKQNVVVTNINGGATVTGMQHVLDNGADGYTLIINGADILVPEALGLSKVTVESFKSICIPLLDNTCALVVNKASGFADLKDLVAKSIASPNKIEYGGRIGAFNQLHGIAMNKLWKAKMKFVDVGNNAAKLTALLAKQTQVINISYSLALDYFKTGEFFAVCLLGPEKNALLPNLKLASDFGYPNVDASKFFWIGAHPNVSDEIIDILVAGFKKVYDDPEYQKYLKDNFLTPVFYAKDEALKFAKKTRDEQVTPFRDEFLAAQ